MKTASHTAARTCEICGKSVAFRGHPECSKKKQELHAADKRTRITKKLAVKTKDDFAVFISAKEAS